MKKIKLLIADDHSMVRESLRTALEFDGEIEIIGEAVDGIDAIEKAVSLLPEIILLDINMPLADGLIAAEEIRKRNPEIKILILTMHDNKQYIYNALALGIEGYIFKMSNLSKLISAIKAVAKGDNYFDSAITEVISRNSSTKTEPATDIYNFYGITDREKEIINLIIAGFTTQEIAKKLKISFHTASNHRNNILKKFQINNTAELILFAVKEGLYVI